jgi:outer membrane lipoprotein carrier protein
MRSAALVRVFLLAGLLGALSVASGAPPSANAPDPEAAALVERIEAYHRSLPHFEARFEQRFSPRIFGRDRVETGRVTAKRPARMRWDYEDPEPKVFVSDGHNTWFYVPAEQQVMVGSFRDGGDGVEAAGGGVNPIEFLTGDRAILDHFDALLADEPPDSGLQRVALVPRRANPEITSLSLVVAIESGRIHGIESEDVEGNRMTFQFTDFRFGTAPEDSLFTFTIPPGTDVVTASDFRQ